MYGVKPNSIGDMRYVTVPYAISLLTYLTDSKLDLYKIWRNQSVSESLKDLLYSMMKEIEPFIKKSAPGGLYGECAKKEECWLQVKAHKFSFDLSTIKADLIDKKNPSKRQVISEDESSLQLLQEEIEKLKSIPYSIWKKIEDFGNNTKLLSALQCNIAFTIAQRVRTNTKLSDSERTNGLRILGIVFEKSPDILFDADDIVESESTNKSKEPEITMELIKKMVDWDRQKKRLKPHHFRMMFDIVNGKEELTPLAKKYCLVNFHFISKYGFKIS